MNREAIKDAFRSNGDEFHYRDDVCDVGGDLIGPSHLKVSHFVVQRSERGQNIASTLLDCLIEVCIEEDIHMLTIEMQATECRTLDGLEEYRDRYESDDPTVEFLKANGFQNLTPVETYQWGLVFRATRPI